jgi:hypothetical protein
MLFRWVLALVVVTKSFSRLLDHDPLAWLMVPLMFVSLQGGGMEQPTTQGFLVISLAFCLAALKRVKPPEESAQILNIRRPHVRIHQRG